MSLCYATDLFTALAEISRYLAVFGTVPFLFNLDVQEERDAEDKMISGNQAGATPVSDVDDGHILQTAHGDNHVPPPQLV